MDTNTLALVIALIVLAYLIYKGRHDVESPAVQALRLIHLERANDPNNEQGIHVSNMMSVIFTLIVAGLFITLFIIRGA